MESSNSNQTDTPVSPSVSISDSLANLVEKYDDFVQQSTWYASFVEAVRALGLMFPNRFSGEDITGEAFYSFLNILNFYHEGVLAKPRIHPAAVKLSGHPLSVTNPPPRGLTMLNGLQFILTTTECLTEIGASQFYIRNHREEYDKAFGDASPHAFTRMRQEQFTSGLQKTRWSVLTLVESLKCILRLYALYLNRGKILLSPNQEDAQEEQSYRQARAERSSYERYMRDKGIKCWGNNNDKNTKDGGTPFTAGSSASTSSSTNNSTTSKDAMFHNTRALYTVYGRGVRAHGDYSSVINCALDGLTKPESPTDHTSTTDTTNSNNMNTKEQPATIRTATSVAASKKTVNREGPEYRPPSLNILGEILYWIRPVVYTASRVVYGHKSLLPTMISMAVDALAFICSPSSADMTPLQKDQWDRRKGLYLLYMFRAPLLNILFVNPLQMLQKKLGHIPLLGFFINALRAITIILEQHYFYTAGS